MISKLHQKRADYIYNWLSKLKQKAIEHNAVLMYDEYPIRVESLQIDPMSCSYKYSDNVSTIIYEFPDYSELLESSIPELKRYLEDSFKLYKQIKV